MSVFAFFNIKFIKVLKFMYNKKKYKISLQMFLIK